MTHGKSLILRYNSIEVEEEYLVQHTGPNREQRRHMRLPSSGYELGKQIFIPKDEQAPAHNEPYINEAKRQARREAKAGVVTV